MTTPYPAEYYYPEFINSRSDDPRKSPPPRPPLTSAVIATTSQRQFAGKQREPTNLANNVVTNQGLPDVDITQSTQTDPKKSLIRNPNEKNIARLFVHDNILLQGIYSLPNLDDENNESNQIPNRDSPNKTKVQTRPIEYNTQHHLLPIIEDQNPVDEYWKKEVAIDGGPVTYDKGTYEGPFGLSRKNGTIYYISVGIVTFLSATFLILTGIFYAKSFPDSSSNSAEIAGIGICAFAFYLGLQLILIGIWQQKYRHENPSKKISKTKKSVVQNDSSDYLKTSMENNEQYDYSYQHVDNTPYGHYSSPPYVSNVNEQMLLQQPGAATGAAYYESVLWPSNVEIETQPDAKVRQSMDWAYGLQTLQSSADVTTSPVFQSSIINRKLLKKNNKTMPTKTVAAEQPIVEFDNIQLDSNIIEQPLPSLTKAPETYDLIKSIAQMEQSTQLASINDGLSPKKSSRSKRSDSKTEVSFADDDDDNHHHHHHHGRHHHHHESPHHRRHHSHHHHHQQQHRHHSHHSHSPCSECLRNTHSEFHREHIPHHHYQHSEPPVRVISPNLPKIITPTPMRFERTIYRDTGINTGFETKIMRDSSVTADLEDVPYTSDNRFGQIPVIRRTIIVEPYPAQPSSQIIVKPRADMIGKIRLGNSTRINGENETIVYPSTAFMTKKPKKKKKKTIVNNIMIEDLQLEDVNNDDHESIKTRKSKISKISGSKTIKNAFYN